MRRRPRAPKRRLPRSQLAKRRPRPPKKQLTNPRLPRPPSPRLLPNPRLPSPQRRPRPPRRLPRSPPRSKQTIWFDLLPWFGVSPPPTGLFQGHHISSKETMKNATHFKYHLIFQFLKTFCINSLLPFGKFVVCPKCCPID